MNDTDLTVTPGSALGDAHIGDITGALGTIRQHDQAPRLTWAKRLLTLLAIMGPGLIVMIADNDAGGVATYAQAGQNYGTSLLWTLLLLVPVLIVNQEMVVRLGAVTGVGHARLIIERFGRFWGMFSAIDLLILNFLTIVTEFIGVGLALSYFGVSRHISVPIAAAALIAMTVTGSFRRWERFMYVLIATSLLVIPLAVLAPPHGAGRIVHDSLVPHVQGGLSSNAVLLIIAIVGTTVAPWQLFFQQSNVIDKRITPHWISYERMDTVIGAFITTAGAAVFIIAAALAFGGTALAGKFSDAGAVATGLRHTAGGPAGAIFAVILLDASILGAAAVTLSTSYAFGDVVATRHSLHRSMLDAKLFYGTFSALVVIAAAIVLIPKAPLGLMTLAVQALAGVLLPSASVFLLLLCNDRDVLGPWVNPRWLNVVASIIVAVLLLLSFVLVAVTLFPNVNVTLISLTLGVVVALGLATLGVVQLRSPRPSAEESVVVDRYSWRMPPLSMLAKPKWSTSRRVGIITMRGYLVVAVLLLGVKVAQLALGG